MGMPDDFGVIVNGTSKLVGFPLNRCQHSWHSVMAMAFIITNAGRRQ